MELEPLAGDEEENRRRRQEFDQLLQNLHEAAAFLQSALLVREVDNWFLLGGCLQSQRAIFAGNRNVQLSGQAESGGFGFMPSLGCSQDSLPQSGCSPPAQRTKYPHGKKGRARSLPANSLD